MFIRQEARDVAKLIGGIDEGREYILRTGRHEAIIRKHEGNLEYLEMQNPYFAGWRAFEKEYRVFSTGAVKKKTVEETLHERFACRKTVDRDRWDGTVYEKSCLLIPVDSVKQTEEFKDICGYINTETGKQKKGLIGGEK